MAEARIVWILGAGFSFPLGGPLLPRLLSEASFSDFAARDGEKMKPWMKAASFAVQVYQAGLHDRLWGDAEDFLDRLDTAARGGLGARFRRPMLMIESDPKGHPTYAEMLDAARRLVALECSHFVRYGDPRSERWSAHYEWLCGLNERHTLVTFNYDRAIETMELQRIGDGGNGRLVTALPGEPVDSLLAARSLVLYKLHGSVDWIHSTDDVAGKRVWKHAVSNDPDFIYRAAPATIGIAMPGPAKKETTSDLVSLWRGGEKAIASADAIVFVGYRFPETDSIARARLLGAIESAVAAKPKLRLHTVLGVRAPDDVTRLRALLVAAGERANGVHVDPRDMPGLPDRHRFAVTVHPMYSQDFFSVYREEMLLP